MIFGTIFSSLFTDMYGRKLSLVVVALIQSLTTIILSHAHYPIIIFIMRFIYGICYGHNYPITLSVMSEILPKESRGKFMVILTYFISLGRICSLLLA